MPGGLPTVTTVTLVGGMPPFGKWGKVKLPHRVGAFRSLSGLLDSRESHFILECKSDAFL